MRADQQEISKPRNWASMAFSYSLLLVVVTLPLGGLFNSIAIVCVVLSWIAEGHFLNKLKLLLSRPLILICVSFYLFFLMGMLYTENMEIGRFNLEKKMSLLAIPLAIGTSQSYTGHMRDRALGLFAFSCVLAAIVCFGKAIYYEIRFSDPSYFFHEKLTSIIELQAPYFGMYMAFACVIIGSYGWRKRASLNFLKTAGLVATVLFIFCFVILLSARTATVFLLLYAGVISVYVGYVERKGRLGVGMMLVILSLIVIFIASSSYLQDRFIGPILADSSAIDGGQETGLSIRIVKWKCSIDGFMKNPLLGVGTGDAVDYLVQCYEKRNFWGMYPQYRFNSHNQFLETALTLGVLGLVVFLSSILFPMVLAFRSGNYLLLSFLTLFSFCCLTESVLERQWGIVFFTFFVSLFSFAPDSLTSAKRV